jgi:hypothetical protein
VNRLAGLKRFPCIAFIQRFAAEHGVYIADPEQV